MPFGGFESLQEVMKKYQVKVEGVEFIRPAPMGVNAQLRERLSFFKINAPLDSEEAICEFIIAPILQEMWLMYADSLMLWSHVRFGDGPALRGTPGKLEGAVLTRDPRTFTVTEMDHLFAALHFVFEQAKVESQAAPPEVNHV